MDKELIDLEEGDQEACLKEMGPQVVATLQATTKSAKGVGIRKAKEIEGREEGKKMRAHSLHGGGLASYDGSEHGGMKTPGRVQNILITVDPLNM